jgi:hypothetical protein
MVKPVVLFGSETWAVTVRDMVRLGTGEREIFRIYGPVVEQGLWRKRTNQELKELYKDLGIKADIKKEMMEWTGHLVRMDHGKTVKKIFE